MYAERNSRLCQGPASDRMRGFSPRDRTNNTRSHVRKGRSVVTGSSTKCADFPRDHPLAFTTSLSAAYEEGFPVISRLIAEIALSTGNSITRQGISLP